MGNQDQLAHNTTPAQPSIAKSKNSIDRLYEALSIQGELIGVLDKRLGVVSNRVPGDEKAAHDDYPHIDNIAFRIEENNKELQRLINELVV